MGGQQLYVNVGSEKLEGFVNIDGGFDATQGFSFDTRSVSGIRCAQFIERLPHSQAFTFFREARRVLADEGILRVSTPDLAEIVRAYAGDSRMDWEEPHHRWIRTRSEMVNVAMREWGHQWIYDEDELGALGRSCGFTASPRCAPSESQCDRFRGTDHRSQALTVEFRKTWRAARPAGLPTPLVSILIPAYKPAFFEAALISAIRQDHPRLEIIVSDDSADGGISDIVKRHPDPRVRYEHNAAPFGPSGNYIRVMELAQGEYVKFLNDDDVLAPNCVSRMAGILDRLPRVSLVTSVRQPIDSQGKFLAHGAESHPFVSDDCLFFGQHAAALMMRSNTNFIGEPSTVMFRKSQMESLGRGLLDIFGVTISWCVDMAMWVKLLSAGDLAYLVEPLSLYRRHEGQIQHDPAARERMTHAFGELTKICRRVGMDAAPKSQQTAWMFT